jgi:hypothetical protein
MKGNRIGIILFVLFLSKANAINIEYGYLDKPQCARNGTEYVYVGNILTSVKNFEKVRREISDEITEKPAYDGHIQVTANTAGLVTTPAPITNVTPIYLYGNST